MIVRLFMELFLQKFTTGLFSFSLFHLLLHYLHPHNLNTICNPGSQIATEETKETTGSSGEAAQDLPPTHLRPGDLDHTFFHRR